MRTTLVLLAVLVAASACHKRDEDKVGAPVQLTSVAIDRDREHYRHVIDDEIRWVDRRIAQSLDDADKGTEGVRNSKLEDVSAAQHWRERLVHERADIDMTSDLGWPELKTRIDRDLAQSRPAPVPPIYDKNIGP